jgi:hypothetical protein
VYNGLFAYSPLIFPPAANKNRHEGTKTLSEYLNFKNSENTLVITWHLKRATFDHHPVIPVKAGIHKYQGFSWVPALRFAAAGMTQ